ncbi:MAG TPA: hypothetical protein VIH42_12230 [Thermoguttaceae bacterium]
MREKIVPLKPVVDTIIITVNYHNFDRYHYFNSTDVLGLHIGSNDLKRAFDDITGVIETLMEANYGILCKAIPLMTFDEFLAAAKDDGIRKENTNRCFELRMAA